MVCTLFFDTVVPAPRHTKSGNFSLFQNVSIHVVSMHTYFFRSNGRKLFLNVFVLLGNTVPKKNSKLHSNKVELFFMTTVQIEDQCYSFAVFEVPINPKKCTYIKYVYKTNIFVLEE